jgi:hypothetical protein
MKPAAPVTNVSMPIGVLEDSSCRCQSRRFTHVNICVGACNKTSRRQYPVAAKHSDEQHAPQRLAATLPARLPRAGRRELVNQFSCSKSARISASVTGASLDVGGEGTGLQPAKDRVRAVAGKGGRCAGAASTADWIPDPSPASAPATPLARTGRPRGATAELGEPRPGTTHRNQKASYNALAWRLTQGPMARRALAPGRSWS